MKKLLYLLFFTLNGFGLFAQAPSIEWQKTLGGSDNEEIFDIELTIDGGYITTGYTGSSNGNITINHGSNDMWVIKLDNAGNIQWQKTFGGSDIDRGYKIQQTTDGGYIVIGYTRSTDGDVTNNQGETDLWVLKLDTSGNIQWQKTYGGSDNEIGVDIQQTNDGGYIATGTTASIDGDITMN